VRENCRFRGCHFRIHLRLEPAAGDKEHQGADAEQALKKEEVELPLASFQSAYPEPGDIPR